MSGTLCPSPTVYKVGFGFGIVLCIVTFLIACWLGVEFLKACQRLHHYSSQHHKDSSQGKYDDNQEEEEEEEDTEDPDWLPWWKIIFVCCVIAFCILYFSGDYSRQIILIFCVVASLVALLFNSYFKPPANELKRQLHFGVGFGALLLLTAITFATAMTVFSVHAHAMMTDIAYYDYFGPMRVTGVDAALDRINVGDDENKWIDEMRGQVQLEFGGSWACPDNDNAACVSVTWDDYTCNKIVCSYKWQDCEDDDANANEFTLECQQNRYADALALVEAGTEYDPSVPPEQDENNWQYVTAFGKCSTCEAVRNPEKLKMALDSWNMTVWLLLLGLGLLVVVGTIHWRRRSIQGGDNQVELLPNEQGASA